MEASRKFTVPLCIDAARGRPDVPMMLRFHSFPWGLEIPFLFFFLLFFFSPKVLKALSERIGRPKRKRADSFIPTSQ